MSEDRPLIHERKGRYRSINDAKDPKVHQIYKIQGSTPKQRLKRQANALRDIADEVEAGNYGPAGRRAAVVIEHPDGGWDIELIAEPGHEREGRYWRGLFLEIANDDTLA